MKLAFDVLLWGLLIGVIHFLILSGLYANPFVNEFYKQANEQSPSMKKWKNRNEYLVKMFLGTQLEVFIITGSYLYLKQFLDFTPAGGAIVLGLIFSGLRIYPRFWNMWIQTTYPRSLLAIEFVNGTIGTFIITVGLALLRGFNY